MHADNIHTHDVLGRRIEVFNMGIQAAPLLQQSFTSNGQLASLTDAINNDAPPRSATR